MGKPEPGEAVRAHNSSFVSHKNAPCEPVRVPTRPKSSQSFLGPRKKRSSKAGQGRSDSQEKKPATESKHKRHNLSQASDLTEIHALTRLNKSMHQYSTTSTTNFNGPLNVSQNKAGLTGDQKRGHNLKPRSRFNHRCHTHLPPNKAFPKELDIIDKIFIAETQGNPDKIVDLTAGKRDMDKKGQDLLKELLTEVRPAPSSF
jgi:hypothetical protein